jgi:hypothetical protein
LAILDNAHPALVPLGIKIMRQHHVNALVFQVFLFVKQHSSRLFNVLGKSSKIS